VLGAELASEVILGALNLEEARLVLELGSGNVEGTLEGTAMSAPVLKELDNDGATRRI